MTGVERTLQLSFALRNLLGQLDRQRAAADALAAAARRVGAETTVMYVETAGGGSGGGDGSGGGSGGGGRGGGGGGGGGGWEEQGVTLAAGDAFVGPVGARLAAVCAREALRREERSGACPGHVPDMSCRRPGRRCGGRRAAAPASQSAMRGGGFAGSARRRVRSGGATSSYGSFEELPGNLLGTFSYRWSDEFLKLVGPEVGRLETGDAAVTVETAGF